MCRVEDGPASKCLGRVAEQEAADFIVIGTQGEGATSFVGPRVPVIGFRRL
jgi:hypothetical protein